MLEGDDTAQTADVMTASLTCEIELPVDQRSEFFRQRGSVSTVIDDWRRFPRLHFRGRAVLECLPGLPALTRPHSRHLVYTKDISRGGLAFLHSEPLFPLERVCVWIPKKGKLDLEVVRCERLNHKCYGIGCQFIV